MKNVLNGRASPDIIIWIQTGFIGDIILTTAAWQLAKSQWPSCKQIIITTPIGASALEGQSFIDKLIVLDKRNDGFLSGLYKAKGEMTRYLSDVPEYSKSKSAVVTLCVHKSYRSMILAKYLGFPVLAYRESDLYFLASQTVPRIALFHEAQRVCLLLEPLGIDRQKIHDARPCLSVNETETRQSSHLSLPVFREHFHTSDKQNEKKCFVIGVAPGSVWGTKRWPVESFIRLIEGLLTDPNRLFHVVLIGSLAEKEQSRAITKALTGHDRLHDLVGKTQIFELPRLISLLDVLVANDSSPLHFAAAVNIPTVAIFGATVPSLGFSPLADKAIVVESQEDLPCRPCSDHGPPTCPLSHFKCMKSISVGRVQWAIDQLVVD